MLTPKAAPQTPVYRWIVGQMFVYLRHHLLLQKRGWSKFYTRNRNTQTCFHGSACKLTVHMKTPPDVIRNELFFDEKFKETNSETADHGLQKPTIHSQANRELPLSANTHFPHKKPTTMLTAACAAFTALQARDRPRVRAGL